MENIVEPNESFDFTKLTLAHPSGIQGGAYFTKIEYNKKPVYIQTEKSLTRQGIVKTGKKFYCDLMFDKNSETLINWFEKLEEKCQKLLYEKKEAWFQNSLEESDIESAFNSSIRIYKSGKNYLLRTNVKTNHLNEATVKIYNENQLPLKVEDITSETKIISILEVQGIKFTSRNFQIEIELKQIMVLDNEPIFDTCLIKSSKSSTSQTSSVPKSNESLEEMHLNILGEVKDEVKEEVKEEVKDEVKEEVKEEVKDEVKDEVKEELNEDLNKTFFDAVIEKGVNALDTTESNNIITTKEVTNNVSIDFEIEDLNNYEVLEENTKELQELDLDLKLDTLEPLTLKKPNQVYFDLYKEARNKAKLAKKNAILAYLEAKNIKKTFMLDNLNDSDSDFDNEIDEISESELEGL